MEIHSLQPEEEAGVRIQVSCRVDDGFVFLDGISKPGLGKYLYGVLDATAVVIDIARNSFIERAKL